MSFKSAIFIRVNSEFMQRDHHGGGVSLMLRTPLSLIKMRLLRRQWLLIAFFARAAVHMDCNARQRTEYVSDREFD